jgi:hypothetical protein
MKVAMRLLLLLTMFLTGCGATRDVAATSFHVATAPVRFVHRHIFGDDEEPPPAAPPITTTSDVTNPGQPVAAATPTPARRWAGASTARSTGTSGPKPHASSSSRTASAPTEFPMAKPVPGRAGLVYNPFDPNGGYIDVSGYAPGSKVKDPDSQKIFIVP